MEEEQRKEAAGESCRTCSPGRYGRVLVYVANMHVWMYVEYVEYVFMYVEGRVSLIAATRVAEPAP